MAKTGDGKCLCCQLNWSQVGILLGDGSVDVLLPHVSYEFCDIPVILFLTPLFVTPCLIKPSEALLRLLYWSYFM